MKIDISYSDGNKIYRPEELGEYPSLEDTMYYPEEDSNWFINTSFATISTRKYFKIYIGDGVGSGYSWMNQNIDHSHLKISRIDFTKPEYINPCYHLTREEKIEFIKVLSRISIHENKSVYAYGIMLLRDLHSGLNDYDGPDNFVDDLPEDYPMPDYMLLPED